MGTEEFGSVYESLLELVPRVDLTAKSFSFVGIGDENGIDEEGSTTGNARKTSGSYYTNAELVNSLIKSALEPGLMGKIEHAEEMAKKRNEEMDYEKTILSFSVVDPACGSGHFLLAAARRIAEVLVEKRLEKMSDAAPSQALYRKALRDVITNCIYGVDLNEMAVELTRTALWLEGYEPGKPLEFLNHHIKCGNSLVGVYDLNVLNNGIPDAAYTALSGDEKNECSRLVKSNKESRKSKFQKDLATSSGELAAIMWRISGTANDTIEDQEKKRELYESLHQNKDYLKNKIACDLYTAAFFASKTKNNHANIPLSEDIFDVQKENAENQMRPGIREEAVNISKQYKFFHWKIEFPEIFQRGTGFDCVLGNPPWDRVKLAEKEFFASRAPLIAEAKNKAARDKMILALKDSGQAFERELYESFITALHSAESISVFVHANEKTYADCRYALTGCGDVNMYALFAELIYTMIDTFGTAGFIVPSGIATDDGTKAYFGKIATSGLLKSLYDFENSQGIFPNVHRSFKFSLITLAPKDGMSDFAFFLHNLNELEDSRRHFTMTPEDFDLINPNTHTCPVFRSEEDAKLAKKIYKKAGVFVNENDEENGNLWKIKFSTMFHMSNDSGLFVGAELLKRVQGDGHAELVSASGSRYLPLYEAKLMHQFDHRWNTFVNGSPVDVSPEQKSDPDFSVTPQYYVPYTETVLRATSLDLKIVQALREAIASASLSKQAVGERTTTVGERSRTEKLRSLVAEKAGAAGDLFVNENTDGIDWQKVYASEDLSKAVFEVAEKLCPKYLMGFRGITNVTNERTVISSIIPFSGVGHSMLLYSVKQSSTLAACLLANFLSLELDVIARMKLGGTNLTYGYFRQFPVLPPSAYHEAALSFIVPRVMTLTYTANDMTEWAKALWNDSTPAMRQKMLELNGKSREFSQENSGSTLACGPYIYDDIKRAILRAELDAYFARLYGLTRTELQYILDPHSVMGEDYPSETFRVLKDNEIAKYGEYRTQRLVLEAWDRME